MPRATTRSPGWIPAATGSSPCLPAWAAPATTARPGIRRRRLSQGGPGNQGTPRARHRRHQRRRAEARHRHWLDPAGRQDRQAAGGMCVNVYSPTELQPGLLRHVARQRQVHDQGLPAGRYQAEANPGCNNNGNYAPANYPGTVRVSDGKTTSGINMYMQPGGTLTGKVTDAADRQLRWPVSASPTTTATLRRHRSGRHATQSTNCPPNGRPSPSSAAAGTRAATRRSTGQPGRQEAASTVTIKAGHTDRRDRRRHAARRHDLRDVQTRSGRAAGQVCVFARPSTSRGLRTRSSSANATTTERRLHRARTWRRVPTRRFCSGCEGTSAYAAAQQWFKGQPDPRTAGLVATAAGQTVPASTPS